MAIVFPFYRHEQEAYRLDLYSSVVDEPNVEDQSFVGSLAMPFYIEVVLRFTAQKTAVPDAAARVWYVPLLQAPLLAPSPYPKYAEQWQGPSGVFEFDPLPMIVNLMLHSTSDESSSQLQLCL